MSKFKVGDRVRAYGSSVIQSHTSDDGPIKGVVNSILGESVEVATDCGSYYTFHVKQLRRLKPKAKPREFWVNVYPDHCSIWTDKGSAELVATVDRSECIRVQEVRNAKKIR
jgi:hypothetical protein